MTWAVCLLVSQFSLSDLVIITHESNIGALSNVVIPHMGYELQNAG